MWPELIQPPGGSSGSKRADFHAALQHLCSLAVAGEHGGPEPAALAAADPDALPLLLLGQQPSVAAAFLRQLGRQHWGWEAEAAGSGQALEAVRAALAGPGADVFEEDI